MAGNINIKEENQTPVTSVPNVCLQDFATEIMKALTEEHSMSMHHVEGQPPKLEINVGRNTENQVLPNQTHMEKTRFLLVWWNVPILASKDGIKGLFERSKYGYGHVVKNVTHVPDRSAALVEFTDESSVDHILRNKPIFYNGIELYAEPFKPLLDHSETHLQVNINGLRLGADFIQLLQEKQLKHLVPPTYGLELMEMMQPGARVVRRRDWRYGNQDGENVGTVTYVMPYPNMLVVCVQWDYGLAWNYRMGGGFFDLKLAPTAQ